MTHEKFDDGAISAINFRLDVDRWWPRHDHLDGKFLGYNW
ncbi:hypothetical protein [Corynebacterium halotolerans]